MVMLAHCDRCLELLTDGYATWVETLSDDDPPKIAIYHLAINAHDDSGQVFCRACMLRILRLFVEQLEEKKAP